MSVCNLISGVHLGSETACGSVNWLDGSNRMLELPVQWPELDWCGAIAMNYGHNPFFWFINEWMSLLYQVVHLGWETTGGSVNSGTLVVPTALLSSVCHPLILMSLHDVIYQQWPFCLLGNICGRNDRAENIYIKVTVGYWKHVRVTSKASHANCCDWMLPCCCLCAGNLPSMMATQNLDFGHRKADLRGLAVHSVLWKVAQYKEQECPASGALV